MGKWSAMKKLLRRKAAGENIIFAFYLHQVAPGE